ncbi:MAG: hypothetical protein ACREO3_08130 [Arenimonas sp.]
MSTIDDIRAEMAKADGAVQPRDIAEALDLDPKAVRNALYQAWTQKAGVEKYDDGTYGLIPGWKSRHQAAEAEPQADEEEEVEESVASKPRKAREPKATRPPKPSRKPKRVAAEPKPERAPRKVRGEGKTSPGPVEVVVTLPVDVVRTLARAAIASKSTDPDVMRAAATAALALV